MTRAGAGSHGAERERLSAEVTAALGTVPAPDDEAVLDALCAATARVIGADDIVIDLAAEEPRVTARFSDPSRRPTDAEEHLLGLVAALASTTSRRASMYDAALRRHLHEHAVLNAMADGVAVLDRDGCVSSWNLSAARLTGVGVVDVLGERPPFLAR